MEIILRRQSDFGLVCAVKRQCDGICRSGNFPKCLVSAKLSLGFCTDHRSEDKGRFCTGRRFWIIELDSGMLHEARHANQSSALVGSPYFSTRLQSICTSENRRMSGGASSELPPLYRISGSRSQNRYEHGSEPKHFLLHALVFSTFKHLTLLVCLVS